jgi:methyl-accepting chemotaxis protein
MIIRNLSVRAKLILTTLVLILVIVLLALVNLDASRGLERQMELLKNRSELNNGFLSLQSSFYSLSLDVEASEVALFLQEAHQVEAQLRVVMLHESLDENEGAERTGTQILALLDRFNETLRLNSDGQRASGIQAHTDMVLLGSLIKEMDRTLSEIQEQVRKKGKRQMGILMTLGIIFLTGYLIVFTIQLNQSFHKLLRFTDKLGKGSLPPPLDSSGADEFGKIARHLNTHRADLQKKIHLIQSMSEDGPGEIFTPDTEDQLGNAMLVLSDYLTRKELSEVSRNREDKKQNWISEGFAQLGEVLRSERDDVGELSFQIVQKLVTYMNLEMGSLFVTNDSDPEELSLDLAASYAFDRRKYKSMNLAWGAGLPGTCAQEKERIFITDVPADYFEVSSGLGSSKPNCILLVPLKIADWVMGVIELATVRLLRPFEMDFVESLSESIASSLMAVRATERTARLLKQSQAQAETLKEQEAAVRENVSKLEQAQVDSTEKEAEINGILQAINQSTLVAELGLNGRYTSINEKFLMILESHEDQVLGKLHSDFAKVDRTSDTYKAFWADLKAGKSQSNTEIYRLYSGDEVWLQQTFTPIINSEGRVYKILNIAVDMTEKTALQEQLESRKQEITRRGLDMQTLNQAVNSALIKCELDAEGIIMNVNDNYCQVTGYGRKELLGRNYRLFLKDSEKPQFDKIWNEVIKEKVYEGSIRRSRPTGEEVWLVSTFSPVKNETGEIYKVYYMGLDITEKKLKYQLLEDANKEIERLKGRLKDYEV